MRASDLLAPLLLGWSLACGPVDAPADPGSSTDDETDPHETESETAGETEPDDGILHSDDPEAHGLDPAALDDLRDWAFGPGMLTQALLVLRHGVVVAEWYDPNSSPEAWVTSWSMAKSVTATLIAIAIQDGLIPSLDEPLTTYIPEWSGTEREAISLRHALAMATGFAWGESEDNLADLATMALSSDQLARALDQELVATPGEVWNYSSGTSMLLSRVLAVATGMSPEAYAMQELAGPLGFERFEWWRDGAGNTLTYCCIDMTARDTARLGKLYLQRGIWDGEALLEPSMLDELTRAHQLDNPSYGLQFWLNAEGGSPDRPSVPRSLFYALGHDKQLLMVLPEQELVIVRHSRFTRPEGPAEAPNGLLEAGMMLEGLGGSTGSWPPGDAWDDTLLLELTLAAIVD